MKLPVRTLTITVSALYAVILFLLLALYRVPADRLISAALERVSGGRVLLQSETVIPGLIARYTLKGVHAAFISGDTAATGSLDSLTLGPDFGRFLAGYLPVRFEGTLPRGTLRGKTGLSMWNGTGRGYIRMAASGVYLEDLPLLRSLSGRGVTGMLTGEIDLKGPLSDFAGMNGEGRFRAENGSIDTRIDLPGMKTVPFNAVDVAFTIKDRVMNFSHGNLEGPMFSGDVSGQIQLQKRLSESRLMLTFKIKPGPLIEKNPMAGQILEKLGKGDRPLLIRVKGTLKSPIMAWN